MSIFAIPGIRYWITLGEIPLEAGVYFKLPNGEVYRRDEGAANTLVEPNYVPVGVTVVKARWANPATEETSLGAFPDYPSAWA